MIFRCFRSDGESFYFYYYYFSDILHRYANQAARFISAYGEGLSGTQAIWANKRYHGHHTLPPDMIAEIKKSVPV